MDYGKLLKKLRTDRGLSLKTVASALGIGYTTLSNYENNRIDPPLSKFVALLEFYRIDPLLFLTKGEEYLCITQYSDISRKKIFAIDAQENRKVKEK